MKLNWLERISHNLKLEWVITSMETLLEEAQNKHPEKDYSESEKKVGILREFQKSYLETINENEFLEKRYSQANARVVHLVDEVTKLKQENENLKQSIITL